MCLAATGGDSSGGQLLYTTDTQHGQQWCIGQPNGDNAQGGWGVTACNISALHEGKSALPVGTKIANYMFEFISARTPGQYSISMPLRRDGKGNVHPSKLGYGNGFGATGPLPHTQWIASSNSASTSRFYFNLTAAGNGGVTGVSGGGSQVMSVDTTGFIDDDNTGTVVRGGEFCLELNHGSALETWAGPLSGWEYAVALFNRSPSADTISVEFSELPRWAEAGKPTAYAIHDVWSDKDIGVVSDRYSAEVPGHGVALLVLTPQ
jgi:hypothetical protein